MTAPAGPLLPKGSRARTRRGLTVDFEGGELLNRRLNALAESMQASVLEEAVLDGGDVLLAEMEVNVPRKDGVLAASLGSKIIDSDQDHADAGVGASDPKAHLVEYGHQQVVGGTLRSGEGRVVGHVPAHPFARPAYDATKDQVIDAIGKKIKAAVEAAAKTT